MKTPAGTVLKRYTFGVAALSLMSGAWLCFQLPHKAWAWVPAMLILPVAWLFQSRRSSERAGSHDFQLSLALAGSLLALSLVSVVLAQTGWQEFSNTLSLRGWGVLMGLTVVVFANVIPKQTGSARRQSHLRVVGWSMVLGGLAYALAWLVLPMVYAWKIATGSLLIALLLAVGRVARDCFKRQPSPPHPL